jgi:hypothetical protein
MQVDRIDDSNDSQHFFSTILVARTTQKKFIGRGWQTYHEVAKRGQPFQEWLKGRSFAHKLDMLLPEIEEECRLINEFASIS